MFVCIENLRLMYGVPNKNATVFLYMEYVEILYSLYRIFDDDMFEFKSFKSLPVKK